MRIICTLSDQQKAYLFSSYLIRQGIDNHLEMSTNSDWSSPDYGTATCKIWIIDEEKVEQAQELLDQFLSDPNNPQFLIPKETTSPFQEDKHAIIQKAATSQRAREPMGIITRYILIVCTILFIISSMTTPTVSRIPDGLPYTPFLTAPVYKKLMFDYPTAFDIVEQMIEKYGIDIASDPDTLPINGQKLYQKFLRTPYWRGIYEPLLTHYKNPNAPWVFNAPLFEKEKEGEVWRLFTPIFLHSDLFHLFFNMVWLILLGKQMEKRLGKMRYLLFIALCALISNTAQYLMSGSNFIGFSGVLCAMITFIWFRQKRAAWEGYQLESSTMGFISIFILLMFALQVVSFFIEAVEDASLPIRIANTAHLVGAFTGYIFARFNLFAWYSP